MIFFKGIGYKRPVLLFFNLLAFTIVFVNIINAQPKQDKDIASQYVYNIWNNKNGDLPHNGIYDLLEDDEGYIWITTEEGLVQFDGNKFKTYNQENTPGLHSSWFINLCTSATGGIWASTRYAVVLIHKNNFQIVDLRDYLNNSLINAIAEDKEGILWVGTTTGELFFIKGNSVTKFTKWNPTASITVEQLTTASDGLLIGTDKGVFKLDYKAREVYVIKGLDSLSTRALAIDHDGSIWVGTHNRGLIHKKSDKIIHYTEKNGLKDLFIMSLSVAPDGKLWIGTSSSGVQTFSNGQFSTLEEKGFKAQGIRNILFTGNDMIWLGTQASGLVKMNPAEIQMLPKSTILSGNIILPIYEHPNGDIWIGTAGNGINRIKNNEVISYTRKDELANEIILSIAGTKDAVYIGNGNGLNRFNLKTEKIDRHYTVDDGLANNIVQVVYQDSKQRLWIGTLSGGIHLMSENGKIERITVPSEFDNAKFISIYEDSKNNIWMGSMGSGMLKIGSDNKIKLFPDFPSNLVMSFFEDSDGTMWFGTMEGLVCYYRGKFHLYSKANGLQNNSIYSMIDDDAGYLWLSGNFGLQRIQLNELEEAKKNYTQNIKIKSTLFDAADGMANSEANGGIFPAGWKMRNGNIWFPTIEGVAIVQPELIRDKMSEPNLLIQSLDYGGKKHAIQDDIAIPPGVLNFEINYTSIDFTSPHTINYYYRLKGLNDEWENVGNRRTAYFTAMDPGKYIFEVKAEQFGNWSEASDLSFTVKPFFYQTFWFRGIFFILFLITVYFIIKYYLKYQQEARLKALVNERTKELKESNERFGYVTKATNEAIWDYDLLTNTVFFGEGYKILFGYNSEGYQDISIWPEHLHPEDKQRVVEGMSAILESTANRWSDEYRFLKANGDYAQVEDKGIIIRNRNGKAVRMIGAMQDVTRQKEGEQNRKLLESVVTFANDGVMIVCNEPGYRIAFVNDALAKITGYKKEEFIGKSPNFLNGSKTDSGALKSLRAALKRGDSCDLELLQYEKTGEEIWINHSIAPVKNEKGEITHWISTLRDISERQAHIKAIEEQNLKLKAIAWTQSHVVRAPLAKMIGFIDLLENYDSPKLDINMLLNHIKTSGAELDLIIKDIVNKTEAVKKGFVDKKDN